MSMSTDDLIIVTNLLVALTSILVAAATEHEAVKGMRDTVLGAFRMITHLNSPPPKEETAKKTHRSEGDSIVHTKPGDGEEGERKCRED